MTTTNDTNHLTLGNCRNCNEFLKIHRIGEGTYGTVYGALDKTTNKLVALKRIILHNEDQDGFPITSIREITCLKESFGHPNIVQLHDVIVGSKRDQVFLLFEYCEHDLATITKKISNPFTEAEIKSLMNQLFSALEYLHDSKHIIHRDIKLSNLLYNNQGQLKLADFGLARSYDPAIGSHYFTPNVVTLWYRAPEILLGSFTYTYSIDLWAIGCTFGELLLQQPLLPGDTELDQIQKIFHLLGAPNNRIWPAVEQLPLVIQYKINLREDQKIHRYNNIKVVLPKISDEGFDLLNRLLAYDPTKRLKCHDALKHEYFYSPPYPKEYELMPTFRTFHKEVEKYL